MPPDMDLFTKLPIDFSDHVDRGSWARSLWYVFCQLYAREHAVTELILSAIGF